jgi:superfamily II DNA or RNA helicase
VTASLTSRLDGSGRLSTTVIPQAADPHKVMRLVDLLVIREEVTPSALGVTAQRQVSYYRRAAQILGFVDDKGRPTPRAFALDGLGREARLSRFVLAFESSECGRAWLRYTGVKSLADVPPGSANEFLRSEGLAGEMLKSRGGTLRRYAQLAATYHPHRVRPEKLEPPVDGPDTCGKSFFGRATAGKVLRELATGTRLLRAATAYFTVRGYDAVADRLENSIIHLLVGSEEGREGVEDVFRTYRRSIERGAQSAAKQRLIRVLRDELVSGTVRVRLFHPRYKQGLHAKVFLFDARAALLTSANLTGGGLKTNIEAGSVVVDADQIAARIEEFDRFFEQGEELRDRLLHDLEESWAFAPPISPNLVYLRTLLTLFGEVPKVDSDVVLAEYQRMVVGSVLHRIKTSRGGLLVSPVGTGKTIMSLYCAAGLFPHRFKRVVVFVPNQSMRQRWEKDATAFNLPVVIRTHGFLREQGKNENNAREMSEQLEAFIRSARSTDLVIVDEAHQFRNPDGRGATNLRRYLAQGERPACLLVTATPMSKGLHDLNQLLGYLQQRPLSSVDEVALHPAIINITRPFILEHFGRKEANGTITVDFGKERRSFAQLRFHRTAYHSQIDSLLEAIAESQFVFVRSQRDISTGQLSLPGVPEVTRREGDDGALFRITLLRMAESSPRAIADFIDRQLARKFGRDYRPADPETFSATLKRLRGLVPAERGDRKFARLGDLISNRPREDRILVFTTFRATAKYLVDALAARFPNRKVAAVTGETSEGEKAKLLRNFAPVAQQRRPSRRTKNDIDILVATDTIAEGENLQDAVVLVNYDLHWTPLRLIQRVGRLDRPTVRPREVDVHNFYPASERFDGVLNLWNRIAARAALYDRLGRTRVLEDMEESEDTPTSRDVGLVNSFYEKQDWERLLAEYVPTSQHLADLAKSSEEERARAMSLPIGARTAKAVQSNGGVFILVRHEDELHCVHDGGGELEMSPDPYAHEALLPHVRASPATPLEAEPEDALDRLSAALRRWCEHHRLDEESVEMVCGASLIHRPTTGH